MSIRVIIGTVSAAGVKNASDGRVSEARWGTMQLVNNHAERQRAIIQARVVNFNLIACVHRSTNQRKKCACENLNIRLAARVSAGTLCR